MRCASSGETEACQQIHRVNPRQNDFKGTKVRRDRLRLLLHCLFENRMSVPPAQIEAAIEMHVSEHLRLGNVLPVERQRIRTDFVEAWSFARNRSAARHVPYGAALANATGNPEPEQRVQAAGVVATDVSLNAACSKAGTDNA